MTLLAALMILSHTCSSGFAPPGLITGDSLAEGRRPVGEISAEDLTAPRGQVYVYSNDASPKSYGGYASFTVRPHDGFWGPDLRVRRRAKVRVLLAGSGGTSLSAWQSSGAMYTAIRTEATRAGASTFDWAAVIHGGLDATTEDGSTNYQSRLSEVVLALIADFDIHPERVGLVPPADTAGAFAAAVIAGHQAVGAALGCPVMDTSGLTTTDGTHWDADSQRAISDWLIANLGI